MNQHPPHHLRRSEPPEPAGEPAPVDVVAGDPPVPITVWRTARTPADTGRPVGARLAARLIAAYSRPGDTVVDLTDRYALAAACTAGRRRHRPAWFTDTGSLLIGPATPTTPEPATQPTRRTAQGEEEPADLAAWFGDDLTDPDLPPTTGPGTPPPDVVGDPAGLVAAHWPLGDAGAAGRVRLAWLLTGAARLLRPGGCLILVLGGAGTPAAAEDFTGIVAPAATAGLGYLQHIVAVTADTRGDAFVYHATDEELLALAAAPRQPWPVAHLRVHADLVVFTRPQPPRHTPVGTGGRGGGRRD